MNKDLKNEYEKLLESDIPDLWSRIEPQLHEKEPQLRETAPQQQRKKSRRLSSKQIYFYSGIAAACLCLAIALPVIIRNMGESKNENSTAGGESMAVEEAMDASASDDMTPQENAIFDEAYDGMANGAADIESTFDFAEMESVTTDSVFPDTETESTVSETEAADFESTDDSCMEANEAPQKQDALQDGELLIIQGDVQGAGIFDDQTPDAMIIYEISLDENDKPEKLSEFDIIQVVQYPDEDGNLKVCLEGGKPVKLLIRYEEQDGGIFVLVEVK